MKKSQLFYPFLAIIFIASNWFSSKSYELPIGMSGKTAESFSPILVAIIFALALIFFMGRRTYSAIREILNGEIKIEKEVKIFNLWPVLYFVPLFFQKHQTFVSYQDNGVIMTHNYGYGTEASSTLFFLAVISILLFQFVIKTEPKINTRTRQLCGMPSGSATQHPTL